MQSLYWLVCFVHERLFLEKRNGEKLKRGCSQVDSLEESNENTQQVQEMANQESMVQPLQTYSSLVLSCMAK